MHKLQIKSESVEYYIARLQRVYSANIFCRFNPLSFIFVKFKGRTHELVAIVEESVCDAGDHGAVSQLDLALLVAAIQ